MFYKEEFKELGNLKTALLEYKKSLEKNGYTEVQRLLGSNEEVGTALKNILDSLHKVDYIISLLDVLSEKRYNESEKKYYKQTSLLTAIGGEGEKNLKVLEEIIKHFRSDNRNWQNEFTVTDNKINEFISKVDDNEDIKNLQKYYDRGATISKVAKWLLIILFVGALTMLFTTNAVVAALTIAVIAALLMPRANNINQYFKENSQSIEQKTKLSDNVNTIENERKHYIGLWKVDEKVEEKSNKILNSLKLT